MAINAYVGLMGSGKSYEVVASVILPALLAGRRVVTNIDGLNPDLILDYLEQVKGGKPDKFGQIVQVKNEDLLCPGFFPAEGIDSLVQPGDLVVVDECWQFWATDKKLPPEHMNFFRMHRHYTHPETGLSCDLALIIQDLGTLHRNLRSVVEMTSRMVKLKSLGLNRSYRVEVYETYKITKKTHINTINRVYDKAIFPLYKSYAGGNGKEVVMDSRQNLLKGPKVWMLAALVVFLIGYGLVTMLQFFQGAKPEGTTSDESETDVADMPAASAGTVSSTVTTIDNNTYSERWRVVGRFMANDTAFVVVANEAGKLRLESPSMFYGDGLGTVGTIDGERVTYWSGSGGAGQGVTPEVVR